MKITKYLIALTLTLISVTSLQAQVQIGDKTEAEIIFRVNNSTIYPDLASNESELDKIVQFISGITDPSDLNIDIVVSDSPEGSGAHNVELAKSRAYSAETFIRKVMRDNGIEDNRVTFNFTLIAEDWDGLIEQIEKVDFPSKSEILIILRDNEIPYQEKKAHLKTIDSDLLSNELFPPLRRALVQLAYGDNSQEETDVEEPVVTPEPVVAVVQEPQETVVPVAIPVVAETPIKETKVRGPWSFCFNGGVNTFYELLDFHNSETLLDIKPDANIGFNYHFTPCFRMGVNFGYSQLTLRRTDLSPVTTVVENYPMEGGRTGVFTTRTSDLINRNDQQIAHAAATMEFNPFGKASKVFGMWIGFGAGYMSVWDRSLLTQAISEEVVSSGVGYFFVENHDRIETTSSSDRYEAHYIPAYLNFDIYIDRHVALTLGAHGYWLPLAIANTPDIIVGTDFGLRITF